METKIDIRWEQRFSNYIKALDKLSIAVEIIRESIKNGDDIDNNNELLREGLIQRFEYTQELAWNVMSDYAKYQGFQNIAGSRDAIRYGLEHNLISSKDWMKTVDARNRTSHTYNEETANDIINDIIDIYYPLFITFKKTMDKLRSNYSTEQKIF